MNKLTEKENGYLFGLFEGDGYKYYCKKYRHYQIEFYLNSKKDKEIISFLLKLLDKLNLNVQRYLDKRFDCLRIRVNSKDMFHLFEKGISLDNKDDDFCLGYISGLIDSDGYVNPKKYSLSITNTNQNALINCQTFLKKININSSLKLKKASKKDKKKTYLLHISVNFKRLAHLSIKTGKLDSGMEQPG